MTITTSSRLELTSEHRRQVCGPIGDLYLEIRQAAEPVAPRAATIVIDPHYSQSCGCPSCTLPRGQ